MIEPYPNGTLLSFNDHSEVWEIIDSSTDQNYPGYNSAAIRYSCLCRYLDHSLTDRCELDEVTAWHPETIRPDNAEIISEDHLVFIQLL